MRNLFKKIILLISVLFWLVHSSFAASSSTHHTRHASSHAHIVKQAKVCTSKKARSSVRHVKSSSKHHSQRKSKKRSKPVAVPNIQPAAQAVPAPTQTKLNMSFFNSIEARVIDFVHKTVNTLRYSAYKLGGTKFDRSNGIYVLDCSDYVDHILEEVYPDAYVDLMQSTGTDKPTTQHFYSFFSNLTGTNTNYWSGIQDIKQLQAGDILVFRYKNPHHGPAGGHVMVVMDKPTQDDEDGFIVRVTDSARVGHSEDTREGRVSGIGIGTMHFKVNPKTGQPSAYAWKVGSRWQNNVKIAMARPSYLPL